jgi:protein SCO1
MSDIERKDQGSQWPILAGLALVVITLLAIFGFVGLRLRRGAVQPLLVYGQIADFTLTNQDAGAVSLADLRGKVWVADIIFTRCAGPCPIMTRHMKELQQALPPQSSAKLVTLTTDPDFDTPAILKAYAERFGTDTNRWMFLTGTKPQIGRLAIDSLKLSAVEKRPEERDSDRDLFVHSTIFVVVDRQARLRGAFETTGEGVDPKQAKAQILAAVEQLEREP